MTTREDQTVNIPALVRPTLTSAAARRYFPRCAPELYAEITAILELPNDVISPKQCVRLVDCMCELILSPEAGLSNKFIDEGTHKSMQELARRQMRRFQ